MPGPNRTPPDDDGFEVVDDPVPPKSKPAPKPPAGKPPVAKLLPPKPGQPARPTPKPAPVDAGFEVVDDYPPPPPRKKPAAADSGFEVVDDDPPPRSKKKSAPPADDFDVVDEDEPQSKKKTKLNRALTDDTQVDDEDDDRPRKKKKKGKRGNYTERELEEMEREKTDESNELMLVAGISLIGFLFLMIGAYRLGGSDDLAGNVSRTLFMGLVIVYILIKVPVTIVGLMIIGQLFGIEYGTIGKAVRNLFAVNLIADGVAFLGDSLPIPGFVVFIVGVGVTFGVFQTLFSLDPQETWTTLVGLNVLSFLFKVFLIIVVVGFLFAASRRANRDNGPMDNGNNNPAFVDPGDNDDLDMDEDEQPQPKNRRGRGR